MPSMSHDAEYARAEVVKIAKRMTEGDIRPLLGARLLFYSFHQLEDDIDPETWRFITGVHSESDALPIGPDRQHWAPAALREKDKIADDYEQRVRDRLIRVAKELVAQFSKP
jgi:hypothetical protein